MATVDGVRVIEFNARFGDPEVMNLLSLLRLGVDFGMFNGIDRMVIDELFLSTQPAHLQQQHTGKLGAEERDVLRATMLRNRLKKVKIGRAHV